MSAQTSHTATADQLRYSAIWHQPNGQCAAVYWQLIARLAGMRHSLPPASTDQRSWCMQRERNWDKSRYSVPAGRCSLFCTRSLTRPCHVIRAHCQNRLLSTRESVKSPTALFHSYQLELHHSIFELP